MLGVKKLYGPGASRPRSPTDVRRAKWKIKQGAADRVFQRPDKRKRKKARESEKERQVSLSSRTYREI